MNIKTLLVSGYKSLHNRTFQFDPITLIIGRNGSGKSSILEAIRIALIGYDPVLGRQLSKRLSAKADIQLTFDTGELPVMVPFMLDFSVFNSLTGPAQMKLILQQARNQMASLGYTKDGLFVKLRTVQWENATEAGEAMLSEVFDKLKAIESEDLVEWLDAGIDALKILNQDIAFNIKRLVGAIQTLAANDTLEQFRTREAIEADIMQARHEIKVAEDIKAKLRDYELAQRKIQEITAWLNKQQDIEQNQKFATENLAKCNAALAESIVPEDRSNELNATKLKAAEARKDIESIEARLLEINDLLTMDRVCLCCKKSGDDCSRIKSERLQLKDECSALTFKRDVFQKTLEDYSVGIETLEAYQVARASAQHNVERLKATVQQLEKAITDLQFKVLKIEEGKKLLIEYGNVAKPDGSIETGDNEKKLEQLGVELVELGKSITAREQKVSYARELKQNQEFEGLYKALNKILIEQRNQLVNDVMGFFVGVAQRFASGVIRGVIEWRDGEIMLNRDGEYISHKTLSGTERAVVYTGITIALCQSANYRVVLFDEMGVIDSDNVQEFLANIKNLIASGVIHQFIGCDVSKRINDTKTIHL